MYTFRIVLACAFVTVTAASAYSQSAALPSLPVTQLDTRQTDRDLDGPRISVGFVTPTPIHSILLLLVRDTRLSVVPDPSLDQTFVGDLKNVTVRQALDLILEPLGLDYSVRGRVVRVFPRELETRFYGVDYVSRARGGSATDLYSDVAEGVRTLLSDKGRMSLDRTAAMLQVTDTPARIARVEQYLEATMLRATRQVQIEARVIEIELRDELSAGINWPALLAGLTRPADATAVMTALASQGRINVLSSPFITAMNNEPAVMRISTQDVVTEGVTLNVTPQIGADGIINLSINPTIAVQTGVTSRAGDTVPIVSIREANTLVRVRQGETIVIAGWMHDRATTGDAGAKTRQKTDVVILLTPTIVGPSKAL